MAVEADSPAVATVADRDKVLEEGSFVGEWAFDDFFEKNFEMFQPFSFCVSILVKAFKRGKNK